MAPSFSRISSGALLLALAYNARPVKADFWEDVDNCKLVLDDLPADLTTDFCYDWTYGYEPEDEYVTITDYPVTVTEYPDSKTCEGEGYSTTTKYPEYTTTPEPSKNYWATAPTSGTNGTTEVPSETTSVPDETTTSSSEITGSSETTDAPEPTETPEGEGDADVTVTSTIYTTYWTTSTIYDDYPAATPAPYRRQVRASWCVDRPCRLVQYDDDTIVEACKKYLPLEPQTKTVNVPGYTVTITSYPTDCKKPDPYPVEEEYEPYEPEPYKPEPEPEYPEYPPETPEYEPEYPEESYPEEDYEEKPAGNTFDNNYSGPDGPKPWDDNEQTSELADAIEQGGYDDALEKVGLDDAEWNAIPSDYGEAEPTDDYYEDSKPDYYEDSKPDYYEDSKPDYYEDSKPDDYEDSDDHYDSESPKPWDDNGDASAFADALENGGWDHAEETVGDGWSK
ncbi:hypothetical protein C7974DRAFT_423398 [Boeremia exigua]|uniref:uncharacterized protein n=1 Tax=Boeremia exigua TaxID=749465 RepID=UPI001E8D7A55|nr:uncharacterized protein C7974DRAFT_423398 [Boeremia exigua]KAH6632950.1 hypothetical protein C7974DRAFT_423398 [Boeremia exigua]